VNFFRVQHKGIEFEEMKDFCSCDGDCKANGLAVCLSPNGLDGGSKFGGAWDAMDEDDDLVVLKGRIIDEIYDGYIIRPIAEVARFTIAEWRQMLATGEAWDWEEGE